MKLGKNRRFSNICQLFSFFAKLNFLKDSFTTTLYLLDFIGFWPTFGLFHYSKLPSYKRVRWGRLAGPLVCFLCLDGFYIFLQLKSCTWSIVADLNFLRTLMSIGLFDWKEAVCPLFLEIGTCSCFKIHFRLFLLLFLFCCWIYVF